MFKEEGGALFDSRSAALGHTLQGNIPSPMDRARAVRLALRCMRFLEEHHEALRNVPFKSRQALTESAAVIVIQGTGVRWVTVQEMTEHADMKKRRGKTSWWAQYKHLTETLVARKHIIGEPKPDKSI
jgi:6-phosphofructokinase 1